MDSVDRKQQAEIDRLTEDGRVMKLILLVTTLASVAQIVECIWLLGWGRK